MEIRETKQINDAVRERERKRGPKVESERARKSHGTNGSEDKHSA